MSSFTSKLVVSPNDDGRTWTLEEPFTYDIDEPGGRKVTVPTGFVTDFASVPRFFWRIFPPWDRYGKAAVLHDYLYSMAGGDPGSPWPFCATRRECDGIFLEAMAVLKTPAWVRFAVYHGVRLGGWVAWRQHRRHK